jgi:hypothetical protein
VSGFWPTKQRKCTPENKNWSLYDLLGTVPRKAGNVLAKA